MKLAKAGYYGGSPDAVMRGRVDMVLAALEYESYASDWQSAYSALHHPKKG